MPTGPSWPSLASQTSQKLATTVRAREGQSSSAVSMGVAA